MIIPTKTSNNEIFILDDEPEHIEWLVEYLEAKGLSVTLATNAEEAIELVNINFYKGYILDLNIPLGTWQPNMQKTNTTYEKYKGLYIAKYIRSQGVASRNVIAYSAHTNTEIKTEADLLYIEFVAKGRAYEFKQAIKSMISG
ncbi:response regulator [Pseudomonas sp. NY15463]|uniref:response regulator n=1 Tax=Pseudomonas sp. NY15463 TaxID=3400361 RepID=UPI003A849EA1